MLASDELGIPVDKITVKWGDTDLIPEGGGTGGSRSLQQGGAAVQQASQRAARRGPASGPPTTLEASPADLVFDAGRSAFAVAGDPDASVPLATLAEPERLFVRTVFTAPGPTFPFGAHVAVVEVDTETGKAVLRRMVTVDDAGTVINPLLAEGQRHGGIAQGAAQAFLRGGRLRRRRQPADRDLRRLPVPVRRPRCRASSWSTWRPRPPTTRSAPRASARPARSARRRRCRTRSSTRVAHLGVRHIDMPTTPQRVWRAIRSAKDA